MAQGFHDERPRQLQALVAYPREDLEVELKGWLDVTDGEEAAALMKAALALANHGGGYVLIGFTEELGTWVPDEQNRPAELVAWDQDKINGMVARYAEPAFHCEVHHVENRQTGQVHPVVASQQDGCRSERSAIARSESRCGSTATTSGAPDRRARRREPAPTGNGW